MKIPKKRELQQIALNHSRDINSKDLIKIYKCTAEPYSFLVNDATLASDNPLRLRNAFPKCLWERRFKNKQRNKKTIEDQRKKEVAALKYLKPKEQTKAIEGKSDNENNQSIGTNIFNNLNKKTKSIMNELYEIVDQNKLYFEYVGPTKDVSFYEYYDSKKLFNETKK